MGYSCTAAAMETLEAIMDSLPRARNWGTNSWSDEGREYIYEIGPEQADGRIAGSYYRMSLVNPHTAQIAGRFCIAADGALVRGPSVWWQVYAGN